MTMATMNGIVLLGGADNRISLLQITELNRTNQALIARGAFGHVDIAILVHQASSSSSSQSHPRRHTNYSPTHVRLDDDVQSVSLAAIKTIPNATVSSSTSSLTNAVSLTREAFAELNALRLLNGHENVTPLLGFFGASDAATTSGGGFSGWNWADDSYAEKTSPSSLCLVFPYHPVDLAEALNHRRLKSFANGPPHQSFHLPPITVQSIMHDILSALKHVHGHHILHRDIKPSNMYITNSGRIQLGDFGLAKAVSIPEKQNSMTTTDDGQRTDNTMIGDKIPSATQGLCTLQYRPPELLLGGTGIINGPCTGDAWVNGAFDIWSAGCVLAELITLSGPLFPGQSVFDQIGRIFNVLGTPTEENWPGASMLPDWNKICFERRPGVGLQEKIERPALWEYFGPLINKMISLDPTSRPSAHQCLQHAWLESYVANCNTDESWRRHAHRSVVDQLIPPSLQIAAPIYYSPPERMKSEDGTSDDALCNYRFSYAKQYALQIASSRRSSLKSAQNDNKQNQFTRWSCDSTKPNGLLHTLRKENPV
jgi:serine/threonine protein kinase